MTAGERPRTLERVLIARNFDGSEKRDLILRNADEMGYEKRNIRRYGARSILNIALFLPFASMAYQYLFRDAAELIADLAAAIAERDVPAVELNRIEDDRDFVTCDNHIGMQRLLEQLAACREDARPCCIRFTPAVSVTTYREEGFRSPCVALNRSCQAGSARCGDSR